MKALARANRERADRRYFSLLCTGAVNRSMIRGALEIAEPPEGTPHSG